MAFFNNIFKKSDSSVEKAEKPHSPSIKDLQARAYERWASEGSAEPKGRRISGFEAERARRHSAHHDDLVHLSIHNIHHIELPNNDHVSATTPQHRSSGASASTPLSLRATQTIVFCRLQHLSACHVPTSSSQAHCVAADLQHPATQYTTAIMTSLLKPSLLNPVFTGSLYYALTEAPAQVRLPLLIGLNKLLSEETIERIVSGLKWLAVLGLLRKTSSFLSELGQNNWRLRSEKHRYNWPNEIAVVTGAAGGFGQLLVKGLIKKGVKVVAVDVAPSMPPALRNNRKVKYYQVDITNPEAVKAFGEQVRAEVGNPSILINNAGIAYTHTVLAATSDSLEKIFKVNVISHYYLLQQFLPSMIEQKKGHVVSVSSMAAYITPVAMSPYCATKAGVLSLHEGLGTELRTVYKAPEIKLTIVHPTFADTPMVGENVSKLKSGGMRVLKPEEVTDAILKQIFAGRGRHIVLSPPANWISSIKGWPSWASQFLLQLPERRIDTSVMPPGFATTELAQGKRY